MFSVSTLIGIFMKMIGVDMGEAERELRCEACGRVIKVDRGEQTHPVWQKNGVMRIFCTLPMCDLDARVVEEEELAKSE